MAKPIQDRDRSNLPNSPACGQWETLLVDAMDGLLLPEDEATFSNHMAGCAACTEMFEQVRRGREWLEFLSPEPQVPGDLLEKILVETGHGKLDLSKMVMVGDAPLEAVGGGSVAGSIDGSNVVMMTPVWQRPGFSGSMRRFAEPRLLMTAAMAFFSIALTLSMTGVRISAIKISDLRPASIRSVVEKRVMTASTPIVRYYDHLRFVYEVESRMRELRRSSEQQNTPQGSSEPAPRTNQPDGETQRKDGGSRLHPDQAPQQTVNPSPLWNGEAMDAELGDAGVGPQSSMQQKLKTIAQEGAGHSGRNSYVARRLESDLAVRSIMAMPDRSASCIA